MITMLMRNQNAIKAGCIDTFRRQALLDFRRADSGIDQEPGTIHLHIDCIAFTAAGQYRYLHII